MSPSFALQMWGTWSERYLWDNGGRGPDLAPSGLKAQSAYLQTHQKRSPNRVVSVGGQMNLWRGLCVHLSIHCSAVDICWAAGHSCPWRHSCAITAGTTWALSGDPNCSPDHLRLEVNLALRRSCALKQSPQTKPFLWSFSMMWFVKIVYGNLLPTHCCSYLKTYLDGILQSLLKFAWITLLIFYCSTRIKWQAEMLIRLKFSSAMQVPLMFQLAL